MLKLKTLGPSAEDAHFDLLSKRFDTAYKAECDKLTANGEPYEVDLLEFLITALREILVGSSDKLEELAIAVQVLFPEFTEYSERAKKGGDAADRSFRNTLKVISKCFDYDVFSRRQNGWSAYSLVKAHRARICPYCQAHHVNYYIEPTAGRLEDRYRIRPPLDHFLPRSLYPFLAVSLYNLIPSCHQCNSSVKTSADPLFEGVLSPMDASAAVQISFSAKGTIPKIVSGTAEDVHLDVIGGNEASQAHIDFFYLQKRYEWYRNELRDLITRYHRWHKSVPAPIRNSVSGDIFVLGFAELHASDRAVGHCLRDVLAQLKTGALV